MIGAIILVLFFASILIDAYADSYYDTNNHRHHKAEMFLMIITLAAGAASGWKVCVSDAYDFWPIVLGFGLQGLSYVALRFGAFNLAYNTFRNLKKTYTGTTDEVTDKKLKNIPNWLLPILYLMAIFAAVVFQFIK